MTHGFLSDVEARAQRRRTRTRDEAWQGLVRGAWERAQAEAGAERVRWLERAHRMLPLDGMIAVSLAGALLGEGLLERAAGLFAAVAERHGIVEGWAGLATCAHLMGDAGRAERALGEALRVNVPTETLVRLALAVAGERGWCGLMTEGVLVAGPGVPGRVLLDGQAVDVVWEGGRGVLPLGWRSVVECIVGGERLRRRSYPPPARASGGGELVGSPLAVGRFGVEGFVEGVGGGLRGWAWFPADAERVVPLVVEGPEGRLRVEAREAAEGVEHGRPLARPRAFALAAGALAGLGAPLTVRGEDGRQLWGSPLSPGLAARPVWADEMGVPARGDGVRRPVAVVVPVYRGEAMTMACLASVLAARPRGVRVIVVEDASPEPGLMAALQGLARRRRIELVRLAENGGFPGAANAGMRAAAGCDVVLLNSDTLVAPGWIERLRAVAYGAADVGTVTPLTNDGTIVSYPDVAGGNAVPGLAEVVALDGVAQATNAGVAVEVPVGVGFCLYVRGDCLAEVGPFREDVFAQGYGEENDFCLRARHAGWRHVAAAGVFVGHVGGASFGGGRAHLMRRNGAVLERLHPGYGALVARHVTADPLGPARARMDAARWAAGRMRAGAVVMISHGGGGGVERVIAERAAAVRAQGRRAVVLRPAPGGVRVEEWGGAAFPNLVFAMPDGLGALVRLLRGDRVRLVEVHHLLGHHHAVVEVARRLKAELVSVVHDYARFCPRIALVSTERRYCGEPDVAGCEACVADLGSLLEDDPPVRVLLDRSGAELRGAGRVVAPSLDAAARIGRHFPGVRAEVEGWEDDGGLPPVVPVVRRAVVRVVVVGAIGVEKGYEVLLGCVRDARARALPLEFVVVGYTADDERLMTAGPAFVTGEYAEADAAPLVRAQEGALALIPSVFPETWCFALTRAWEAGLAVAVFDLGAQAERVRRTGRGWVLPLGMGVRGVNDWLLRAGSGG